MFFLVVALARVLLSDAPLYRPGQRLFLVGVVENLAVITLYVVTRTVGIPFFIRMQGRSRRWSWSTQSH